MIDAVCTIESALLDCCSKGRKDTVMQGFLLQITLHWDVSPRKKFSRPFLSMYLNRLVFTGGGELDKEKTADLMETLMEPSQMRGNDPNALQNPCRPTVIITDTVSTKLHSSAGSCPPMRVSACLYIIS